MSLDTIHPDVLNKICYYVDPQGYTDIINSEFTGDILYIAPGKRRSKEAPFTYTSLQDTNFRALACVNKSLLTKISSFIKKYQKVSLKEPFYKEAVVCFLKKRSIEFFLKKISIHEDERKDEYEVGASVTSEISFGDLIYNLEIFANPLNNSNNQFHKSRSHINNFASILSCCAKNKEQVQQFIKDIKLINSRKLLSYSNNFINNMESDSYGVVLRFSRKINDNNNLNVFSLSLFCQLVDFAEKIVTNDQE
jgi:hypothetical protein